MFHRVRDPDRGRELRLGAAVYQRGQVNPLADHQVGLLHSRRLQGSLRDIGR
jgi:hypothetical protein